jgi:hypothetical protein
MRYDPRIAIVTTPFVVDETTQPFGKRWRQQEITLTTEHVEALQAGKWLALDVLDEYVIFVRLNKPEREEGEERAL